MPSKLRHFAKKASLSLIYRAPPLPQNIRGKWVWVHPRARLSISAGTFFRRETHVQMWLAEHLRPGQVFFDVGAHHGWVSLWALALVGGEGAVHSFEPAPANLSILEWHRRRNDFPQWILVPQAVSDADAPNGQFFLIDSGDSPMNSLTSGAPGMPLMEGRDIGRISIQTVTLDTYCAQFDVRPNLVKIDVEGAELLVLRGASRLLGDYGPTLILAVHPYWLPAEQEPAQILALLKAHGYAVFDSKGSAAAYLRSGEYLCINRKTESVAAQTRQNVGNVLKDKEKES